MSLTMDNILTNILCQG